MKGMLLKNKASIQYVLTLYSMENNNKQYKYIKSDSNRLVVRSIHDACAWSMRVIYSKKHEMWLITRCKGPHNCTSLKVVTNGKMMDSRFISIALKQYVWKDITRSIKDLYSMLHVKHGHKVTMYKVWEAKQKAIARIYENFDESYMKLPQFLAALNDANPNTVTLLNCDPRVPGTCIFNFVF